MDELAELGAAAVERAVLEHMVAAQWGVDAATVTDVQVASRDGALEVRAPRLSQRPRLADAQGLSMPACRGVFDLDELSASVWLDLVHPDPVTWDDEGLPELDA